MKPWSRCGTYAIGGLLGYVFHKFRRPKLSRSLVIILWLLAIGCGYITFAGKGFENVSGNNMSRAERITYELLHRPAWAICICWVIWACHYGYGGIINNFLSIKYFVTISKLGYGTYLVHWCVISFLFFTARYKKSFSHRAIVCICFLFFFTFFSLN